MKNRALKRGIVGSLIIIATFGIIRTYHWYSLGDGSSDPISTEIKGPVLSHSDAIEKASSYESDKEYYYKHFVEISYVRGDFPSIVEKVDTIKTELWERKKRR